MTSVRHVKEKNSVNEIMQLLNQSCTGMLTVEIAYFQVEDIHLASETYTLDKIKFSLRKVSAYPAMPHKFNNLIL